MMTCNAAALHFQIACYTPIPRITMQTRSIIIGTVVLIAILVIFLASGKKSSEDKKSLSLQGILGKVESTVEHAAADGSAGQMLSTIVGKVTGAAMAQAESGAPLVPAQIGAASQSTSSPRRGR